MSAAENLHSHPSPFIPGTNVQYAWDSTSLGMLKTCPRLYYYIMIEGWSQRDESVHLRFGIEYHKALEEYDRVIAEGQEPSEALRMVVKDLLIRTKGWKVNEESRAGKYKNRRSLLRTVVAYLDKFADDPAETVMRKDGSPAVEVSFRFELDFGPDTRPVDDTGDYIPFQPYLLCGHLDRAVDFQNAVFVMDRKTTTSTLSSYFFDQFSPNNQMTLYALAGKIVLSTAIKGVIIDGAQVLVEGNSFERGITYRTQDQLEEWTHDLRYWLRQAEDYAEDGYWPMNDTACDKFGGCRFRSICSKSPGVRQQFLKGSFTQLPLEERWNPLKPR